MISEYTCDTSEYGRDTMLATYSDTYSTRILTRIPHPPEYVTEYDEIRGRDIHGMHSECVPLCRADQIVVPLGRAGRCANLDTDATLREGCEGIEGCWFVHAEPLRHDCLL